MENKKTFTYATRPTIKNRAAKKASKENLTLSEKIDQMLKEYVKPERPNIGKQLHEQYIATKGFTNKQLK